MKQLFDIKKHRCFFIFHFQKTIYGQNGLHDTQKIIQPDFLCRSYSIIKSRSC